MQLYKGNGMDYQDNHGNRNCSFIALTVHVDMQCKSLRKQSAVVSFIQGAAASNFSVKVTQTAHSNNHIHNSSLPVY